MLSITVKSPTNRRIEKTVRILINVIMRTSKRQNLDDPNKIIAR